MYVLAAADDGADEHAHHASHSDGPPGVVVHVVVSRAHGPATLRQNFVLCVIEGFAGATQGTQGVLAQFAGLVPRGVGRLAHAAFDAVEAFLHVLDEGVFVHFYCGAIVLACCHRSISRKCCDKPTVTLLRNTGQSGKRLVTNCSSLYARLFQASFWRVPNMRSPASPRPGMM